jgi:hypothetical protein
MILKAQNNDGTWRFHPHIDENLSVLETQMGLFEIYKLACTRELQQSIEILQQLVFCAEIMQRSYYSSVSS